MVGRRSRGSKQSARTEAAINALGACVRELRLAAGWTLEKAAERMDLDLRHLQKVEAGQTTATIATVVRIADGLGVPVAQLLTDVPSGTRPVDNARSTAPRGNPTGVAEAGARPARGGTKAKGGGRATPRQLSSRLGERVAALRKQRRWTQAVLGEKASIALQHLQRIEAGKQNPTLHVLGRLANALEVTVGELLEEK